MAFNRDFNSEGVKATLAQECKDMRSDDSVTTAERLRKPRRDEIKQLYNKAFQHRVSQDGSHKLLNNAFRQQSDLNSETPLIANLCAGQYYDDKRGDGSRACYRELLKPHGLASRSNSVVGSSVYTESTNPNLIRPCSCDNNNNNNKSSNPNSNNSNSGRRPQSADRQRQQYSDPTSASFSGNVLDSSLVQKATTEKQQPQQQQKRPSSAGAARGGGNSGGGEGAFVETEFTATGAPRLSANRQNRQQQQQNYSSSNPRAKYHMFLRPGTALSHERVYNYDYREDIDPSKSRLGMTFPLRSDPAVATNPGALERAASAGGQRNNKMSGNYQQVIQQQQEQYARKQQQQQQQQQQQSQQRRNSQEGERRPAAGEEVPNLLSVEGKNMNATSAAAAAAGGGEQQQQQQQQVPPPPSNPVSGQNSKVNSGRSGHSTFGLNPGRLTGGVAEGKTKRGSFSFGKKTQVEQLVDPVPDLETYVAPTTKSAVPACATSIPRRYTNNNNSNKATLQNQNEKALEHHYASSTRASSYRSRGREIHYYAPERSMKQYAQGLFIDGQQILSPDDVPKVGNVDINAVLNGPRYVQHYHQAGVQTGKKSAPDIMTSPNKTGNSSGGPTASRQFYY